MRVMRFRTGNENDIPAISLHSPFFLPLCGGSDNVFDDSTPEIWSHSELLVRDPLGEGTHPLLLAAIHNSNTVQERISDPFRTNPAHVCITMWLYAGMKRACLFRWSG